MNKIFKTLDQKRNKGNFANVQIDVMALYNIYKALTEEQQKELSEQFFIVLKNL
jgi:hypothetical protein